MQFRPGKRRPLALRCQGGSPDTFFNVFPAFLGISQKLNIFAGPAKIAREPRALPKTATSGQAQRVVKVLEQSLPHFTRDFVPG
jgi:hypothetical protein